MRNEDDVGGRARVTEVTVKFGHVVYETYERTDRQL